MLVPLGQFQKNDFLALVVDVVQQAVGTDPNPILGGELRHDELAYELFRPFPFRPWVRCQRSDGGDDGILVFRRDLGQRFLKQLFNSFAGEDDVVAQLESHFL